MTEHQIEGDIGSARDASGVDAQPFVDLDLLGSDFSERFDEIMTEMSARCPVARTPVGWLLTRHEDVRRAANDWQTFSSQERGISPWQPEGAAHFRPSEADPPIHEQFKKPLLKHFAARAVAELEPEMRHLARDLIATFRARGTCEIGAEFSRRYVGSIFFQNILGVDAATGAEILELIYGWLLPPLEGQAAAAQEYDRRVGEILQSQLNAVRRTPVIDTLLSLEVDGEPASWADKCMTLSLLIVGGLDTTVNSINSALAHLAEHPDDLALLVRQPELMPAATEEFLRLYSPIFMLGRTVMEDVDVRGQQLRRGDYALLSWAASSRDPDRFEDPLTWNVHRAAQPHLAFGAGIHRCLGSHLARVELQVALEEFLAAIPQFEKAPGSKIHWHTSITRGVSEATIEFEPRPDE